MDLNLFRQSALHTNDDQFSTIAWTTLDDVRRKFFDIVKPSHDGTKKDCISSNEAMKIIHKLKLQSLSEWNDFSKSNKMPENIPVAFKGYYKKYEGIDISVGEWLGTGTIAPQNKKFISHNDCKNWFIKNNIKGQGHWVRWKKNNERPENIPSNPDKEYAKTNEWTSWGEFTESGKVANGYIDYLPFKKARKFVHSLNIKSEYQWRNYCKSGKKPYNIPSNPWNNKLYKNEFIDRNDWFGKK
jgi:hypothetical protein